VNSARSNFLVAASDIEEITEYLHPVSLAPFEKMKMNVLFEFTILVLVKQGYNLIGLHLRPLDHRAQTEEELLYCMMD